MTLSRSFHVAANGIVLFFLILIQYSIIYMYHIFFIHSSVDGQVGCFPVLAVVHSAAMNTGVHVSFWIMFFSGHTPRSGMQGRMVAFFDLLYSSCGSNGKYTGVVSHSLLQWITFIRTLCCDPSILGGAAWHGS